MFSDGLFLNAARRNRRNHKWYRVFNEIPVLMMIAALYLVIFKPF